MSKMTRSIRSTRPSTTRDIFRFSRSPSFGGSAVVLLLLTCGPIQGFDEIPARFLTLLHDQTGESASALGRLSEGGVVASILPHPNAGEIAVAGAVRIPVTVDFYLQRFRDIAAFKRDDAVLNIHKFGEPPSALDLEGLKLTTKEQVTLTSCKPKQCDMKTSSEMIKSLGGLDRGSIEPQFRSALWRYISTYLQKGTPGMMEYDDKSNPVDAAAEFRTILGEFGWLNAYAPPLVAALNAPFSPKAGDVEEFVYWSREDFGLKPVISVTHAFIYRLSIASRSCAFIASKQIYADHYLNASLGLTVLVNGPDDGDHARLYVAYFNRTITDGLRGWFSSLQRSIAERRIRSALADNLRKTRDKLTAALPPKAQPKHLESN